MKEVSKALMRRVGNARFATRYFVGNGNGIDVGCGCGCGPVSLHAELPDAVLCCGLPHFGRTLRPAGESAIERVARKRAGAELDRGGRLPCPRKQLTAQGLALLTGLSTQSH